MIIVNKPVVNKPVWNGTDRVGMSDEKEEKRPDVPVSVEKLENVAASTLEAANMLYDRLRLLMREQPLAEVSGTISGAACPFAQRLDSVSCTFDEVFHLIMRIVNGLEI